jgi:hypothetical protein
MEPILECEADDEGDGLPDPKCILRYFLDNKILEVDRYPWCTEMSIDKGFWTWERFTPLAYRLTNLRRPDFPAGLLPKVLSPGSVSLGFVGETGRFKTRLAFVRLAFDTIRNESAGWLPGTIFSTAAAFDDEGMAAREKIAEMKDLEVLLIDDVSKPKFSDAAEMRLYDFLEYRTSRCRTTHWTSNSNAEELVRRMSPDRGPAIVRRLAEKARIIRL